MPDDNHMRKRADWMQPMDDSLLEYLRDVTASSPSEIADSLDYHVKSVNKRLSELHKYGLVDKPSRGLYRANDFGAAYLDEHLDATDLEPRDRD